LKAVISGIALKINGDTFSLRGKRNRRFLISSHFSILIQDIFIYFLRHVGLIVSVRIGNKVVTWTIVVGIGVITGKTL
jgi:hypothetical protein